MSSNEVGTLNYLRRVFRVHEMAICSAVGGWEGVYFDAGFGGLELFGMEDIEDGARVMDGWEWEFVVIIVHYLELLKHVVDCLSERDLFIGFEVVNYLLSCHVFMCDFQRNHNQWNLSFQPQDLIKSMRIKEDIELSCG
jgi:hypothetical protein